MRDEMKLISAADESSEMALRVNNSNGVYIVPAFVGLGAPYWEPYSRGAVFVLTRGANNCHIVRATLESIAYQTYDLLKAMEKDSGINLSSLKVDGGASANDFLMQFQADILGADVKRPVSVETTSLGAAYLAGLETGFWNDQDDIIDNWSLEKVFKPELGDRKRMELIGGWNKAVQCCIEWGWMGMNYYE